MPEEQCARLTDLLTITSDTITHCMVMNGIGGDMLAQEEVPLSLFLHRLRRNSQGQEALSYGLAPWGMNIRSVYQQHGIAVMLIEVEPGVRTLRWLKSKSPRQYGPGSEYRMVTLALPYQYFFVSVNAKGELDSKHSVYFLNRPLHSLQEPLGECHFYNCSVDAYGVHCWICTQGTDFIYGGQGGGGAFSQAYAFVESFYSSSFNASSEHHEGRSFWGKNRVLVQDERVSTISRWVKATRQDPNFILQVPWIPTLSAEEVFREMVPKTGTQPYEMKDLLTLLRDCATSM